MVINRALVGHFSGPGSISYPPVGAGSVPRDFSHIREKVFFHLGPRFRRQITIDSNYQLRHRRRMFLKKALLRPSSIKTELKDILCDNTTEKEKAALSCNMLWSQCPYEVVMSFTRSKPGPRAVRKIGRNLSGTTHPTLPPIGGRPSYSRPKRNCSDLE